MWERGEGAKIARASGKKIISESKKNLIKISFFASSTFGLLLLGGKNSALPRRCRRHVAACCCLLSAVKEKLCSSKKERESKNVHEKLKLKILSSWPQFLVKMLIKKAAQIGRKCRRKRVDWWKITLSQPFFINFLFPSHLVCALLRPLYLQRANPPEKKASTQ